MKEQFIPYEQAVELRQLGFDEECLATYSIYNTISSLKIEGVLSVRNSNLGNFYISAPLWQQAFDWFRIKYGIHFYIGIECDNYSFVIKSYFYHLYAIKGKTVLAIEKENDFNSLIDARIFCLNKLIEIVKDKK